MADDALIEIVPYDPAWPERFESERRLLTGVLGRWLAGSIEHFGSTAVVGLAAKPVIDIMAGVASLDASRPALDIAAQHGYVYAPYRTDEVHWFCKPSPAVRMYHLHLVPIGSRAWIAQLAFRDYLRMHPDTCAEYARLKHRLAGEYRSNREAYTEGKTSFVQTIVRTALHGS